jgi:hypothetical protein
MGIGFRRECGVKAMWIDGVAGHFEIQRRVIAQNIHWLHPKHEQTKNLIFQFTA